MRQAIVLLSMFVFTVISATPAMADREGIPGRRVGGGTRFTTPKIKQTPTLQNKLSAMTFASRNRLPLSLKLKAMYS